MAAVNVVSPRGRYFSVTCESIVCPACRTRMVPEYLCIEDRDNAIFCRCSVDECGAFFMLHDFSTGQELIPNCPMRKEEFSDIICSLSPSFEKIYNEAFAAEQMSLMEVCGVGYRKALEYLVKDYAVEGKDEKTSADIKSSFLGQCIENYVRDSSVKAVAKRAAWLGNDEAHYIRKWENKDVRDLKGLIRLTIRWIEQEKETASLLEEMKERK